MNLKQKHREYIKNTGLHITYKTWLENHVVRLTQVLSSAVAYEEDARKLMENVGFETGCGDTSIKKVMWVIVAENLLKELEEKK